MSLALDRIRNDFDVQTYGLQKEHEKIANNRRQQDAQKPIDTIFTGMRDCLSKWKRTDSDNII